MTGTTRSRFYATTAIALLVATLTLPAPAAADHAGAGPCSSNHQMNTIEIGLLVPGIDGEHIWRDEPTADTVYQILISGPATARLYSAEPSSGSDCPVVNAAAGPAGLLQLSPQKDGTHFIQIQPLESVPISYTLIRPV